MTHVERMERFEKSDLYVVITESFCEGRSALEVLGSVLEAGGNWIAAWLDRLDHKYEVMKDSVPFSMKPSRYFYRQCLISVDPDETMTAQVVEHIGADYVIWASDYPHIDASMGVVKEIKRRLASLPVESQEKVLGGNAMRFYGLK